MVLLEEGGQTIQDGGYWPTYHDYMIVLLGEGGQTIQDNGCALLCRAGHPGHESLNTVGDGAGLHLQAHLSYSVHVIYVFRGTIIRKNFQRPAN
jgi:hypothetical protein